MFLELCELWRHHAESIQFELLHHKLINEWFQYLFSVPLSVDNSIKKYWSNQSTRNYYPQFHTPILKNVKESTNSCGF
jgi:hypothetical protein